MKVIREGKREDIRLGKFQCKNCETAFETEWKDLEKMKHVLDHHTSGRLWEWWSIKCPVCRESVPLYEGPHQ